MTRYARLQAVLRQRIINDAAAGTSLTTFSGTDAGDDAMADALRLAGYPSTTTVVTGRRAVARALRALLRAGVVERRVVPTVIGGGNTHVGDARWCYAYRPAAVQP